MSEETSGGTRRTPRAAVYVDGFNLYRRLLQKRPQTKWLNIEALAERLLPDCDVTLVRYFTAHIKPLPGADSQSPQRQQAYIRALETLPRTTIHLGKFRVDPRIMPVHPTEWEPNGQSRKVRVKKTEEKGSDVALASMLMLDAVRDRADIFIVCSNDSDLVMPLRLTRDELQKEVGLLSPMEPKRSSNELKQIGLHIHRQVTHEA